MIASIVIMAVSAGLFIYWFRYTCLLILRAQPARNYASSVAAANQLHFPAVQASLAGAGASLQLDALSQQLNRDYRMVTYLLRHGASFSSGAHQLEQRMLMLDFMVMKTWYAATSRFSANSGQKALFEMSEIISHFASLMGERAACAAR